MKRKEKRGDHEFHTRESVKGVRAVKDRKIREEEEEFATVSKKTDKP